MYHWALCLTAALSQTSVSQGKKEKKKTTCPGSDNGKRRKLKAGQNLKVYWTEYLIQGAWGKSPHLSSFLRAPVYVFTPPASQITEFRYSVLNVQVVMDQCPYLAMCLLRPHSGNRDRSVASLEQDKKATFSLARFEFKSL